MPISIKAISSFAVFSGEVLTNPGPIGAAAPSSPALARRIARSLPSAGDGLVVELGAGTGAVTDELLKHGIAPDRLVPVELSPNMVRHLRKRFPAVRVLGGDAVQLGRLLRESLPARGPRVRHIVSSLPLRSLPVGVVARIVREVRRLLPDDGMFVQYTYNIGCRCFRPLAEFERISSSVVWLNLPPARVDVFRARQPAGVARA